MPSDRSRTSDDLSQNYKAVMTQQGRVIVDRDFNALQDIINGQLAADVGGIIGPCGTPDNGFLIGPEPSILPLEENPILERSLILRRPFPTEPWNFSIGAGTMYIGGQRAYAAGSFNYFNQPDWLQPTAPADPPATEVISLRLYEQEVSAVEDPDLLDVALGGPDTTQRVRLMRRIERCPGTVCTDAAAHWQQQGFSLDANSMRLVPQVSLQATPSAPASTNDQCDPVVTGGYLGAFNQLIRVETRNPAGGSPSLLWGYDNASFIYRASTTDGVKLTLSPAPVDNFHQPRGGQVVEILRTAALLGDDPNANDPTQPKTLRCVAEARGFVTTLASDFVPSADGSGGTITLSANPAFPSNYIGDTQLFVRIWQGQNLNPASGQSIPLVDYAGQSTGLSVTMTVAGTVWPDGAYWMIAVRPGTPQVVYPERFLEAPQPPDGPKQWMCPLAVLDWAASPPATQFMQDCRNSFENLVNLLDDLHRSFDELIYLIERRLGGCCTVNVRPQDLTATNTLQSIIDSVVGAGPATICLAPGNYPLAAPLTLRSQHSGLKIEACGGGAVIQAANPAAWSGTEGVFDIQGASNVTLCGLTITIPSFVLPAVLASQWNVSPVPLMMFGIRSVGCASLSIEQCSFQFSAVASNTSVIGAAIFVSGESVGLSIRGCRFHSEIPVTSSPPAAAAVGTAPVTTTTGATVATPFNASILHFMAGNFATGFLRLPPPPPAVITTVGVVVAGNDQGTGNLVTIQDALVSENSFSDLTLAVLFSGQLEGIRLQENDVTACFGGFWLETAASAAPLPTTYAGFKEIEQAAIFLKYPATVPIAPLVATTAAVAGAPLVASAPLVAAAPLATVAPAVAATSPVVARPVVAAAPLVAASPAVAAAPLVAARPAATLTALPVQRALLFQAPQLEKSVAAAPATQPVAATTVETQIPVDTIVLRPILRSDQSLVSIMIVNNRIQTLLSQGSMGSWSGVLCIIGTGENLILTGNDVRGCASEQTNVAIVAIVMTSSRAAVNSNIIANEPISSPPAGGPGGSLFVYSTAAATGLAATGNVLIGANNLSAALQTFNVSTT